MPYIIKNNPEPQKQEGEGYSYKRRTPSDSELINSGSLIKLFDQIRMLDADGYPRAYLDWGEYHLEFTRAKLSVDEVQCDVKISRRGEE